MLQVQDLKSHVAALNQSIKDQAAAITSGPLSNADNGADAMMVVVRELDAEIAVRPPAACSCRLLLGLTPAALEAPVCGFGSRHAEPSVLLHAWQGHFGTPSQVTASGRRQK